MIDGRRGRGSWRRSKLVQIVHDRIDWRFVREWSLCDRGADEKNRTRATGAEEGDDSLVLRGWFCAGKKKFLSRGRDIGLGVEMRFESGDS